MSQNTHQLVIVGGGVAGLDLATHLANKPAGSKQLAVTLVDREMAYVWKPMLHTIAAGTSDSGAQQTVFAAQALSCGFDFQPGEAIAIDRDRKEVRLAALTLSGEEVVPPRSITYDTLVLAIGSKANDFGTPGVAEHCSRIDCRSEAIAFNDQLRAKLIKHATARQVLTVAIVGGGATGVELAAELIQIGSTAERYGLAGASRHLKVVLIESGPRLLGPFPENVASAAQAKLEELGVEVRTGARVTEVDASGVRLNGNETVFAELRVWAAGVKAPALIGTLDGVELTRSGQVVVDETLRIPADTTVFALGDCASPRLPGRDMPVPTTAQAAHQQAVYLCKYLPKMIAGAKVPPATYHDFGSLVSLGGFDAYGSLGRFGFFKGGFIRGRIAQLGHVMLYRRYQARIHGSRRGSLLWLIDVLGRRVRPAARLS